MDLALYKINIIIICFSCHERPVVISCAGCHDDDESLLKWRMRSDEVRLSSLRSFLFAIESNDFNCLAREYFIVDCFVIVSLARMYSKKPFFTMKNSKFFFAEM